MNAYEKIEKLNEKEFKRITGVTRELFNKMLSSLKEKYARDHSGGGAPGQPVELRLTLALEYWREYRTYEHMANDHQLPKSTVNEMVMWVESRLVECEEFKLKELKERFKGEEESEIKVINASESWNCTLHDFQRSQRAYSERNSVAGVKRKILCEYLLY